MTKEKTTLKEAIKEAKLNSDLQRERDLVLIRCGLWMFIYSIFCILFLFGITYLMRFSI